MKVSVRVNGQQTPVDAPADMPLLRVLPDPLDLKGAKPGGGIAE